MSRIRIRPASVLTLAAALALAGCASTPLPDLPQQSLPARWSSPTPQAAVPRPPGTAWWQDFHDPQLDALVAQALRDDLNVGQALAKLRAARRLDTVAGASQRPQLRARTLDPIDPDASASFLVVGLDSEWELPLFGRGEATRRMARGDLDNAQADLAQVRAATIAEVTRNWIDLRHAQQAERLQQDVVAARQRQAALQATLVDLHLATPASAAQAQAAALQAQTAMSEPRDAAAAAARRLAVLLGRDTPDPAWSTAAASAAPTALQIAAVDSVPADLLRRRPDIATREAEVLSAAGALDLARADQYGSIGLGGSIRWSTTLLSHRRTATHGIASFGPVIDIPLFDWGIRHAKAKARGDLLEAATLAYRQTVLEAVNEVEDALTALEQQRRNVETQQQVLQAQQQASEVAQQRRRLGLGSDLDVATQQAARDQAALELLEAQRQRDLAYVALHTALGSATAPIPGTGTVGDHEGAQP